MAPSVVLLSVCLLPQDFVDRSTVCSMSIWSVGCNVVYNISPCHPAPLFRHPCLQCYPPPPPPPEKRSRQHCTVFAFMKSPFASFLYQFCTFDFEHSIRRRICPIFPSQSHSNKIPHRSYIFVHFFSVLITVPLHLRCRSRP